MQRQEVGGGERLPVRRGRGGGGQRRSGDKGRRRGALIAGGKPQRADFQAVGTDAANQDPGRLGAEGGQPQHRARQPLRVARQEGARSESEQRRGRRRDPGWIKREEAQNRDTGEFFGQDRLLGKGKVQGEPVPHARSQGKAPRHFTGAQGVAMSVERHLVGGVEATQEPFGRRRTGMFAHPEFDGDVDVPDAGRALGQVACHDVGQPRRGADAIHQVARTGGLLGQATQCFDIAGAGRAVEKYRALPDRGSGDVGRGMFGQVDDPIAVAEVQGRAGPAQVRLNMPKVPRRRRSARHGEDVGHLLLRQKVGHLPPDRPGAAQQPDPRPVAGVERGACHLSGVRRFRRSCRTSGCIGQV